MGLQTPEIKDIQLSSTLCVQCETYSLRIYIHDYQTGDFVAIKIYIALEILSIIP